MTETRPNIVLVSMDSLRGDHCGHLGADWSLTPTMDSMAESGVSFQNAMAPGPQTFSSMPAVFTGHHRRGESLDEYPGETHWERRLSAINTHLNRNPTIPERLQELGYTTGAVTPNPWTSTAAGFDRGFDEFLDLSNEQSEGRLPSLIGQLPGIDTEDRAVQLAINMVTGSSFFSRWEELYDEIERVRSELTEPYFLWVFLLDTHFPFLSSRSHRTEQSLPKMYYSAYKSEKLMRGRISDAVMPESVQQSVRRSYRDTVRASDAFLTQLQTDFAADDPVYIVHSDHGESFGEHGNYGHHHRQLYQENIHVPYLIANTAASASVTEPVSLTSISDATVALARNGTIDPTEHTAPYVLSQSECGTNRAIRGERFKYMESDGEPSLYDLWTDPGERTNVEAEWPTVCEAARTELRRFDATREEKDRLQETTQSLVRTGQVQ